MNWPCPVCQSHCSHAAAAADKKSIVLRRADEALQQRCAPVNNFYINRQSVRNICDPLRKAHYVILNCTPLLNSKWNQIRSAMDFYSAILLSASLYVSKRGAY